MATSLSSNSLYFYACCPSLSSSFLFRSDVDADERVRVASDALFDFGWIWEEVKEQLRSTPTSIVSSSLSPLCSCAQLVIEKLAEFGLSIASHRLVAMAIDIVAGDRGRENNNEQKGMGKNFDFNLLI